MAARSGYFMSYLVQQGRGEVEKVAGAKPQNLPPMPPECQFPFQPRIVDHLGIYAPSWNAL